MCNMTARTTAMSPMQKCSFTVFLNRFRRDERGGMMVYGVFVTSLALGMGALAIDVGRVSLVKSQMQNRADAGALAGAVQLDGRDGAQARAIAVATNAMADTSRLTSDGEPLSVQSVNFYESISPTKTLATGDSDSKFIEVVLNPKQVNNLFDFSVIASESMHSQSTATPNPFICHAPPLMLCDPGETDAALDLNDPANIGRMIKLMPSPPDGAWAPGNYGLLSLPDGSSGAADIERALAEVKPEDCYTLDVTTATGVKTNKVQNGINARFGTTSWPYPAPNVINYPQDGDIASDSSTVMGNGTWDITAYWLAKHASVVPAALVGASRYQAYLYEQGLTYAQDGKQTIYPITGSLPDGFTTVTPAAASIPVNVSYATDPNYDGVPSGAVASNGQARRLVQVAILSCQADGVRGKHTYPTYGRYVEMFITQSVPDAPAGAIYGEVVRTVTASNNPDFHANTRLVQ